MQGSTGQRFIGFWHGKDYFNSSNSKLRLLRCSSYLRVYQEKMFYRDLF